MTTPNSQPQALGARRSPDDAPPIDAIVIGGGFYGCALALFLHRHGLRTEIVESGPDLMQRASYINQARIHGGYHYPRSMVTAWRSLVNFPRFVLDFRECVDRSFTKVYAIARMGSKVNARQFRHFCKTIGAPIQIAKAPIKELFNPALIEEVFVVREFAFNAATLRELMRERLAAAGIPIHYNTSATAIAQRTDGRLSVALSSGKELDGKSVFNCTYAQINTLLHNSGLPLLPLKHEITEVALIEPPPALSTLINSQPQALTNSQPQALTNSQPQALTNSQPQALGITVMDGPFFSTMPFPDRGLYSLTHVRYTPHTAWADTVDGYRDPYGFLASLRLRSNALYMQRDAQRYLPCMSDARYVDSLYEVKTVLLRNEVDDGRPILYREHYGLHNLHLIMGSKIDNFYDVLRYLRHMAMVVDHPTQSPAAGPITSVMAAQSPAAGAIREPQ